MIPDDKKRIITTIPKDQEKQLRDYCKANNVTKSAAVSLALATLFAAGYKVGDLIGQMMLDRDTFKPGE